MPTVDRKSLAVPVFFFQWILTVSSVPKSYPTTTKNLDLVLGLDFTSVPFHSALWLCILNYFEFVSSELTWRNILFWMGKGGVGLTSWEQLLANKWISQKFTSVPFHSTPFTNKILSWFFIIICSVNVK